MVHGRVRRAGRGLADCGQSGRGARTSGERGLVGRRSARTRGLCRQAIPGHPDHVRLTMGDTTPVTRYGAMYGPDLTFLGVQPCDLSDVDSFAGADVVIVGAPFDGGTSHRPGTRFGPMAM